MCCKRKQTNINKNISKTQAHEWGPRKGLGLKRKRKGAREKGGVKMHWTQRHKEKQIAVGKRGWEEKKQRGKRNKAKKRASARARAQARTSERTRETEQAQEGERASANDRENGRAGASATKNRHENNKKTEKLKKIARRAYLDKLNETREMTGVFTTSFTLGVNRKKHWNDHLIIFVETSMSNTLSTAKFIWNFPLRPERKINLRQKFCNPFFVFNLWANLSGSVVRL